jgi:hypothetical protein
MHVGLAIVLPEDVGFDGIDAAVARVMDRYDINRDVDPYLVEVTDEPHNYGGFTTPGDLTTMREHYKVESLEALAGHMQDWEDCPGLVRDGKLYRVRVENPEGRWDGYEIMPFHDVAFPAGVGYVREFPQDDFCRALLLPDGTWHERQPRYQDQGKGWPSYTVDEWVPRFQAMIRAYPNNIIVTVDTHY